MTATLPARAAVPQSSTWDVASMFASPADWEAAYRALDQQIPALSQQQGQLTQSAAALLQWFELSERLEQMLRALYVYAHLQFDTETINQEHAARLGQAQSMRARFAAATAFARPELLAMDAALIDRFMRDEPALQIYRHFFDDLQRQRAHTRSTEIEEVLAQASAPLNTPYNTYQILSDGELAFGSVAGTDGQQQQVAQGTIDDLLRSPDRALRRAAWNAYADGFLRVKNTMAALMAGNVQTSVFSARVRRYASAREAALSVGNIPVAVYDTVIDACNRHLPIWHRYWDIRRRALGLEQMEPCDIFAPLTSEPPDVSYDQAVEWIASGMAPLGADYVRVARAGLTSERWVDIYPNQAKRGGAYSSGTYGSHPFILMSYSSGLDSLSTLAHELGHSMHSYLSWSSQPFIYSDYTIFVAEVASNFNQALTRAYLLEQNSERNFQIAVLEEAMRNFHRYLFLMPILAQFELHMHEQVEQNRALTADAMSAYLVELLKRGYGPAVAVDEAREGITWAQFPHMYANFYVYQYASGIAAANALADRVLAGEPNAAEQYLQFLKAGGSLYPLDALKLAGIDLTSPEPMDRAFGVLAGFVERLDQLLA